MHVWMTFQSDFCTYLKNKQPSFFRTVQYIQGWCMTFFYKIHILKQTFPANKSIFGSKICKQMCFQVLTFNLTKIAPWQMRISWSSFFSHLFLTYGSKSNTGFREISCFSSFLLRNSLLSLLLLQSSQQWLKFFKILKSVISNHEKSKDFIIFSSRSTISLREYSCLIRVSLILLNKNLSCEVGT